MGDVIRRLLWALIVTMAISYVAFLFFGSIIVADTESKTPVRIRDDFNRGIHRFSGIVDVPSECHQLTVRTQTMSRTMVMLVFETWEEPSIPCKKEPSPRFFTAAAFTPAFGVSILATMDGRPFPIRIVYQLKD